MGFYGDDLTYRYTEVIDHSEQQWQQLDEIVEPVLAYCDVIRSHHRDFERTTSSSILEKRS